MTTTKIAGADDAAPRWATAALVLADGAVFWGKGVGAPATPWAKCASTPR